MSKYIDQDFETPLHKFKEYLTNEGLKFTEETFNSHSWSEGFCTDTRIIVKLASGRTAIYTYSEDGALIHMGITGNTNNAKL